jgi:hypothetical protein
MDFYRWFWLVRSQIIVYNIRRIKSVSFFLRSFVKSADFRGGIFGLYGSIHVGDGLK